MIISFKNVLSEHNWLSENTKIDYINKFMLILEKSFKENNCNAFIMNGNMMVKKQRLILMYVQMLHAGESSMLEMIST